jgi:hypothetical protein
MKRFRLVIAAFVAVAMMSLGTAACTPADQAQAVAGITALVNVIGDFLALTLFCPKTGPGCDG